jgi:coenzyme PQQ synthesis protein D (PqqD)
MSVAATQALPAPLATMFARIPDHVVYRPFPHETVVLNLQTGKYHGLNPTAGRMLELLERGLSVRQTAEVVADEFQRSVEEVERDLKTLCADLDARGLIELSTHGSH